jgi:hypothetical protein
MREYIRETMREPPLLAPIMYTEPPPEPPVIFTPPFKEPPPQAPHKAPPPDATAMLNAPPPEAPAMYKEPPPEALAKLKAAPPVVPALIKAHSPEALAMIQTYMTAEHKARSRTAVMLWPKNVPTPPKAEQIRRFKEHSLNLEPPPKPKPVAKPKPMPEAEPTGFSPGDPYYATDGVPWLQCTICYVFQPDALTYQSSCTTMCGRECTYGESQQQEAAVARRRQPYWHRVSSECKCQRGQPCVACCFWVCPICERDDRCGCDDEQVVHAEEGRLMHRLEMEAVWRREMQ